MSAVDQALVEIGAQLAAFDPQHEGLRDFARLNITAPTRAAVSLALTRYDRRVQLLTQARDVLTTLVKDGHPGLAVQEIDAAALADLQANATTIGAALRRFTGPVAADLALTADVPVLKGNGA